VICVTNYVRLNVVRFSVLELTVGTEQTEERTDRQTDGMQHVMQPLRGRIILN